MDNVHSLYNNARVTLLPLLEINRIAASATFAIALLMFATHAWAQASGASVGVVTGTCTVERAGKSIQAADGTRLIVGDKLTTGPNSRMTIGLGDGSQLELNESSTLVLTENILNPDGSRASTKITLLGGLVRSLVHTSPGGAPNFEVHTPNAVASARGTMFDVSYHEGQPPPATP
ncbi:MAG: FecR family protein [Candidatus Binataceae bacterium]